MPIARSSPWIVLVGLTLGCGSSVTTGAPTLDAGSAPTDLGQRLDTGSAIDTGSVVDTGSVLDTGAATDVGFPLDLGAGQCRNSGDCPPDRECRFAEAGCGMSGVCSFITDCAAVQPYCGCSGETFMACPTAPLEPWVTRGACARDAGPAVDAPPSPDAAQCAGASLGRGGGYCAGPADGPLPVTCCTDWNCDPRMVACNRVPPTCAAGEVPSVSFSCYGPCVPATHCAPIACDRECPGGWSCDATTNACRFGG